MKNFIFLSPNFPEHYYKFCAELKNNGFRVLGIGDCPYQDLRPELKEALHEYYLVPSLEDYDAVYRAVAFFIHRYGRVDWLESNNEYWLERDARLRTDFNIPTGFHIEDMEKVKYKSKMKPYYQQAGIVTAAYTLVNDFETCQKFAQEYGYPVIVKPDNGVGASATYKLHNDDELRFFMQTKHDIPYIMEEFVEAEVNSYDAIVNSNGDPIFETGNVTPSSLMDVVNNNGNSIFYIVNKPFDDVRDAGRRALKSFGVKNRFVHFEFFRLTKDQRLGKKGDVIALEVNMRPSGGISPDMMNYANSTNVYKVWADMIAYDKSDMTTGERFYCAFVGRRDGKQFILNDGQVIERYFRQLKAVGRVPDALSGAMGNQMFICNFATEEEMWQFYRDVLDEA